MTESRGVLVQIVTGEMLAIEDYDWFGVAPESGYSIITFHYKFQHPGPAGQLKFSGIHQPYRPAQWIEKGHISMKTEEPLIAVETDKGDVVHVPIKWLMGGEPPWSAEWSIAYHVNGEAMTRVDKIEGREFMRSVRRADIREILG